MIGFSEKLAVIQWKKCLVLLYFCSLRRFKAFLREFIRQFLRKSMPFFLVNTVLGQVCVIANDMVNTFSDCKTSSNSMEKMLGSIVFL